MYSVVTPQQFCHVHNYLIAEENGNLGKANRERACDPKIRDKECLNYKLPLMSDKTKDNPRIIQG